jgi:hypothetical protein
MENTNTLRMVNERGWRMGFANLFHEANGSWWHTRTWLVQVIIWLCMLNGMFAIFLWKAPAETASERIAATDSLTPMQVLGQDQTSSAFSVFWAYSSMALPIAATHHRPTDILCRFALAGYPGAFSGEYSRRLGQ